MKFPSPLITSIAATLAIAPLPAMAFQSVAEQEAAQNADAEKEKAAASWNNSSIDAVLAAAFRAKDQPRDKFRNPKETLAFFQVTPGQTVVEYAPSGGWYTRVLAPHIAPNGKYIALNADSSGVNFNNRAREARAKGWSERFPGTVEKWTGVSAEKISAVELDEIPDEMAGTADRVVVFRSMHGLFNRNTAQAALKSFRKILKDGGMVGVVQHRAPLNETYARANGSRGYVKEQRVIDLFAIHGFELVAKSEINANPKDKADYERGVWHLFPTRLFDKENDAKYRPIGESDRMTLLFRKKN